MRHVLTQKDEMLANIILNVRTKRYVQSIVFHWPLFYQLSILNMLKLGYFFTLTIW